MCHVEFHRRNQCRLLKRQIRHVPSDQGRALPFPGPGRRNSGTAPRLKIADDKGGAVEDRSLILAEGFDHGAATREIIENGRALLKGGSVIAVGHRVVHGGLDYAAPVRVTETVLDDLAKLEPLAPLHQPHNLAPIRAVMMAAPQIPQIACFDTAFHRTQSNLAQAFALPQRFSEEGVRRYGFHGLSYEFLASRLKELAPELANGRIVFAHLGNGASLCAVKDGRSVASTMGFTAVDGLRVNDTERQPNAGQGRRNSGFEAASRLQQQQGRQISPWRRMTKSSIPLPSRVNSECLA